MSEHPTNEIADISAKRKGDWMETFTGRQFWPLDPRADELSLVDIAHALGYLCRFGGHVQRFYSVAEHCVLMAAGYRHEEARAGRSVTEAQNRAILLHDAAEAYLIDLPRPLKSQFPGYRAAEHMLQALINAHFGCCPGMVEEIQHLDLAMLAMEQDRVMQSSRGWALTAEIVPLDVSPRFWPPNEAVAMFHEELAVQCGFEFS